MKITSLFGCAKALVWRDLVLIKRQIPSMILNLAITVSVFNFVFGFIGSAIGMSIAHAADVFIGTVISIFIFIGYARAFIDITDRSFTNFFSYRRSLPLTARWFVSAMIISYWFHIILISLPLLGFGLIFFYANAVKIVFSPLLFGILYIEATLFVALLFVLLVGSASYTWFRLNVWQRLLTPLGLLGCQFYIWKKAVVVWPALGWALACNPITWANEGLRGALFGVNHYLSSTICMSGLCGINILLLWYILGPMIERQEWL